MRMMTLRQVDNYRKKVVVKEVPKMGLRCECGASVIKSNKFCWWCEGMYIKQKKEEAKDAD